MLSLRLARTGKKNRPYFRIIVAEKHRDPFGKHIEIVGHFDPYHKKETLALKRERILHWISVGAQATPTVHNILVDQKIIRAGKKRATTVHKKDTEQNEKDVKK